MAQYFYDPDDDTAGSVPTGWTSRYTAFGTLDVANDGTRNYLRIARTTNVAAHAASFDDPGNPTDVDVFVLAGFPGTLFGQERQSMVFMRATGTSAGTANAYAPHIFGGSDGTDGGFRKGEFNSGTFNGAGTDVSFTPTSTPYAIRTQVVSGTLRYKVWTPASPWTDPTGDEPASWGVEVADATIPGAGFVGWGGYIFSPNAAQATRLYKFGVGTDGDSAPSASTSGSPLATPTGFTFTAGSGVRQLDGSWTTVSGASTYDYEVEENVSGVWTSFASGNTASTSFQLTSSDGVDWGTTYRGRVRAVPA